MPAQWTGEIISKMHLSGISMKKLAQETGWHPKYLSVVLNGHKQPKNAEQKLNAALSSIIGAEKEEKTASKGG